MSQSKLSLLFRRRRKLIRPDVQLRVVVIAVAVASLALLVNFAFSFSAAAAARSQITSGMSALAGFEILQRELFRKFAISVSLAVPCAVGVGILYSFRFAGPIYRIRKHLGEMRTGRWDRPCTLRTGDDLQDVCDELNGASEAVCKLLSQCDAALAAAEQALESGEGGDAAVEALKRLREARRAVGARTLGAGLREPPAAEGATSSEEDPAFVGVEAK